MVVFLIDFLFKFVYNVDNFFILKYYFGLPPKHSDSAGSLQSVYVGNCFLRNRGNEFFDLELARRFKVYNNLMMIAVKLRLHDAKLSSWLITDRLNHLHDNSVEWRLGVTSLALKFRASYLQLPSIIQDICV